MNEESSIPPHSHPPKTAAAAATTTSDVIDFLTAARGLKTTLRTGWIRQEAHDRIESVADHSWRISLMAVVAASSSSSSSTAIDGNKLLRMALVHDLAEATVGDITPHCGVSDADKHARERAAMQQLTAKLGLARLGDNLLQLWQEYEAQETVEARLCKDLDKLEMILQATEYEQDGQNKQSLDGFFDSTRDKWQTELGKTWGAEIEGRRPVNQKRTTLENENTEEDSKRPAFAAQDRKEGEPSSKKQKTQEQS